MDQDTRFGYQALAVCSLVIVAVFVAVAWVVIVVSLWLLGSSPAGAMPPAGALQAPLALLAGAAVGLLAQCVVLFCVARQWARRATPAFVESVV